MNGFAKATLCAGFVLVALVRGAQPQDRAIPILVELFTSEGCSSCPPADALLERLDRSQPVAGAELIVLSEHVDYWNYIGWTDPYSSHLYSKRQTEYSQRLGLSGIYTPQMVVDGTLEFNGSDDRAAQRAFNEALRAPKTQLRLSGVSFDPAGKVRAHVETEVFREEGDVHVAVALGHAQSSVSRGENAGRRLTHVSAVRTLVKIGTARAGQTFAQDIELKLAPSSDPKNLRLIVFVQQPGAGRVLGATMQPVTH